MKVLFHLRGPDGLPPRFEHDGPTIRIGRDPQAEFSLTGSAADSVSWRHARIELSADGAYVSDLGSTNGTFLNTRRLSERARLKVGDRIQLGQTGPLLEVAELDLKEIFPPPPLPLKPRPSQDRRDAAAPERAGNSLLKQPSRRPGDETPLPSSPPQSPPAPAMPPAAAAPPVPAAPKRFTGATMFVGLVNSMQRRQRRVYLVTGAVVLVLTSLVGYLLFKSPHTQTQLSGTQIYNRVVPSTAWIVVAGKVSMGTGALIDKEKGLLLTAYHVVLGHEAKEIFVFFPAFKSDGKPDGEREHYTRWDYPYQQLIHVSDIVKTRPEHDLALLKLDRVPEEVPALPLAENSPEPGELVVTVGNAAALPLWSYADGKVRSVEEISEAVFNNQRIKARMIVTDLAINHGDSGGPLVNDRCKLVGVNSSGLTGENLVIHCIDISEVKKLLEARE